MKKVAFLFLLVTLMVNADAQSQSASGSYYKTAVGIKLWDGAGVSVKMFTNKKPDNAGEFIAYFFHDGFRLTGLYEIHNAIQGAPGLRWYVGPGAHVGLYNSYHNNTGTYIGIDGVIGLDYKFDTAPINISLDWQPAFEFGDNMGFNGSWGGLGIRYTF